MSNKKIVNFKVNGIHCNGCATKIINSISSLGLDNKVEVDISTGNVKVDFDSEKSKLNEIKSKIIDVGFTIEGIELE